MLNDIRLYIGDKLVEFSNTPDIFYNWCETDLSNPITTKNGFSKTINIEGTKNNNDIFGHYWNLERYQRYGGDTGQYYNPSYKVPFSLYLNGDIFERGYVKLEKINKSGNNINYDISLYGGLGSFLFNLSTNYENGTVKTLADLKFYNSADTEEDLGFIINKDTVKEAWENLEDENSKWSTINFGCFDTGIPDVIDTNKVLINASGYPNIIKTQIVSGNSYQTYNGWSLAELENNLNQFEVKDLRSYLQTPLIRVKSIFDSICKPENNKGQFDNGYQVVLDDEFFTNTNPYYFNTWMTLNQIPKLNYNLTNNSGGTQYRISEFTSVSANIPNGKILNFELPYKVGATGAHVKMVINPKVWVHDPEDGGQVSVSPLNLMKKWRNNNNVVQGSDRHGYAVQVFSISDDTPNIDINEQTVLTGSSVYWYTADDNTGYPYVYSRALADGFTPIVPNTDVVNETGKWIHVRDGATSEDPSLFGFATTTSGLTIECEVPANSKNIRVYIKMLSETNNDENVIYVADDSGSTNYYTFEDIRYSTYDSEWSGYIDVDDYSGSGSIDIENNSFYSNKRVPQKALLNTSYSVAEWLMSFCKMFGLYIYKDKVEDKIYILTRNNFYKRNLIEDLTGMIDISKGVTINPLYVDSKFISLTTPIETSTYSKLYSDTYGVTYGTKKVNTGYEFNADTKELISTKLKGALDAQKQSIYYFKPIDDVNPYVFNGFKQYLYKNGQVYTGETENPTIENDIYQRKIANVYKNYAYNADFPYYDIIPRLSLENEDKTINTENILVFFNGYKTVTDAKYHLTDDLWVMSTLNNKPCWIMTKYEDNNGVEFCNEVNDIPSFQRYIDNNNLILHSLDFGSPRELYVPELINNDEVNLYARYYSKYFSDLYDVNTKVLECYIKPNRILTQEDMRHFYWFRNGLWRLNKIIDYNPANRDVVKCQFIKVQDLNNMTNEIATTSLIITVLLDKYTISSSGGTINGTVKVSDYSGWKVDGISGATGVIVTPNSATTNSSIIINIPSYNGMTDRDITIKFSASGASKNVVIKQKAFNGIIVSANEHYLNSGATEILYYLNTSLYAGTTVYLYKDDILTDNKQFINAGEYYNQSFNIPQNSGGSNITYVLSAITQNGLHTSNSVVYHLGTASTPFFYFTENSSTGISKEYTSYEQSGISVPYTTNITSLTAVTNDSWISGVTLYNNNVVFSIKENNDVNNDRSGSIEIKSGNTTYGILTVTQSRGQYYFIFESTNESAVTLTLSSANTSYSEVYFTNISGLSVDTNVGWISNVSLGTSGANTVVNFTLSTWDAGFQPRQGIISVISNSTVVGILYITQIPRYYFYWDDTNTSAVTANVDSNTTSAIKTYTSNINTLIPYYSGWITGATNANNTVTVGFNVNSAGTVSRSATVNIKSGDTTVGIFNINQGPGEGYYIIFNSTNTSATTVHLTSGDFNSVIEYVTTNIPSNLVTYDKYGDLVLYGEEFFETQNQYMTIGALPNKEDNELSGYMLLKVGDTVYGRINGTQDARGRFFYWSGNSSSVYTVSAGSGSTSISQRFFSDYENITFVGDSDILSVSYSPFILTDSAYTMTATFSTNDSPNNRTMVVTAYSGATEIGSLYINQIGRGYYFLWDESSSSSLTNTISSASTSEIVSFDTNYTNITATYGGCVTGVSVNSGYITVNMTVNPNTTDRSGSVSLYSGVQLIGTYNFTQGAKLYFYWNDNNTSAITENIDSGTSSITMSYTTNAVNIEFSYDEEYIVVSIIDNGSSFTFNYAHNPYTQSRSDTVNIKSGYNQVIGNIQLIQAANAPHFEWAYNGSDTLNTTVGSGVTSLTADYNTTISYGSLRFSGDSSVTSIDYNGATGITVYFNANPSTNSRVIRVGAYSWNYNTQYGWLNITQEASSSSGETSGETGYTAYLTIDSEDTYGTINISATLNGVTVASIGTFNSPYQNMSFTYPTNLTDNTSVLVSVGGTWSSYISNWYISIDDEHGNNVVDGELVSSFFGGTYVPFSALKNATWYLYSEL